MLETGRELGGKLVHKGREKVLNPCRCCNVSERGRGLGMKGESEPKKVERESSERGE